MASIPGRADRAAGSGPHGDPFLPTIRAAAPSRLLGHPGYQLVLGDRARGATFSHGRRITPGLTPELECALFVEDLQRGRACWFDELPTSTDTTSGRVLQRRAASAPEVSPRAVSGRVEERRYLRDIEICTQRFVAPGESSELFVVRLRGTSGSTPRLRLTLVRDVAFDQGDAFDSHPAFSKLFLQTAALPSPPGLLLTRRPRSRDERHPVLLYAPLVGLPSARGTVALDTEAWYETDRTRLLGRKLKRPSQRLAPNLGQGSGNVLDPILAIRCSAHLESESEVTGAWLLSVAADEEAARCTLEAWQRPGRVQQELDLAEATETERRIRHGLDLDRAARWDAAAAAILLGETEPTVAESAAALGDGIGAEELGAVAEWGASPRVPHLLARLDQMDTGEREELLRAIRYWSELDLGIHAVLVHDDRRPDLPDSVSAVSCARAALPLESLRTLEKLAGLVVPPNPPVPSRETSTVLEIPNASSQPSSPPSALCWTQPQGAVPAPARMDPRPFEFDNGWGGFAADGTEYVVRLRREGGDWPLPPRPWINVLANPRFGCLLSETGAGTTWFGNSREHRLTPWRNDAVLDPHDEAIYLLDEDTGNLASGFPGPIPDADQYEVRHGFGYSRAVHASLGLDVETLVFVSQTEPYKVSRLRLRNPGSTARTITVASHARLVLGPSTGHPERFVVTEARLDTRALLARSALPSDLAGAVAFSTTVVRATVLEASVTGDRGSFLGPERNTSRPWGMQPAMPLDERFGAGLDPCFAQRFTLRLQPGETVEVAFVLGAGDDEDEALRLAARFEEEGEIEDSLAEVRTYWSDLLRGLQVKTPSRALDIMVNGWLPYQTISCRLWGRSALYQSGGAFGFRDQLQDASSLLPLDPSLTRTQILIHGGRQFVEGDVLHWWHPPGDVGLRTRFVDDLLWLPLITAAYLAATGDTSILEEDLPLLDAPQLDEGEAERFLRPVDSGRSCDLYTHCCLAIDRSLHRGAHGLPLFGAGDWNDGMNRVGAKGRGESVWMGFFLIAVFDAFAPVLRMRGDRGRIERYRAHRDALEASLATAGWDGQWYRRGYFDDGTPLGSKSNDECQIDALVQAWAVLSGVAPRDRAVQAMQAAEDALVSEEDGLIRLLTPAFQNSPLDPGYIRGYVAGVRENGGQYTHAALWLIRAFADLGRRDRVAPLLDLINPIHRAHGPEAVARYQLEPYVVAADVYGVPPHVGRGGWSWYTGSSGWMSRVALESLLGFTIRNGEEVHVAPAIPDEWPRFEVHYRPRAGRTAFEIQVENTGKCSEQVVSIEAPESLRARVEEGAGVFRLIEDGGVHPIRITMGKAAP